MWRARRKGWKEDGGREPSSFLQNDETGGLFFVNARSDGDEGGRRGWRRGRPRRGPRLREGGDDREGGGGRERPPSPATHTFRAIKPLILFLFSLREPCASSRISPPPREMLSGASKRAFATAGKMSFKKLSIDKVPLEGKRVLARVDFNVPLSKSAPLTITNTQRIDEAIPTIKYALDNGAKASAAARRTWARSALHGRQ